MSDNDTGVTGSFETAITIQTSIGTAIGLAIAFSTVYLLICIYCLAVRLNQGGSKTWTNASDVANRQAINGMRATTIQSDQSQMGRSPNPQDQMASSNSVVTRRPNSTSDFRLNESNVERVPSTRSVRSNITMIGQHSSTLLGGAQEHFPATSF